MKKTLALLVSILMVFACLSLAACSETTPQETTTTTEAEVHTCAQCSAQVTSENTKTDDGYYLCDHCYYDGGLIRDCSNCLATLYRYKELGGDPYCDECYVYYSENEDAGLAVQGNKCDNCGTNRANYSTESYDLCTVCYNELAKTCDECGFNLYPYTEVDGKVLCHLCYGTDTEE